MRTLKDKYRTGLLLLFMINYQSNGSGAGIKQVSEQTIDFGASDGPMTEVQLKAAKGGKLLHIPLTLGAVAISYNVPNVPNDC